MAPKFGIYYLSLHLYDNLIMINRNSALFLGRCFVRVFCVCVSGRQSLCVKRFLLWSRLSWRRCVIECSLYADIIATKLINMTILTFSIEDLMHIFYVVVLFTMPEKALSFQLKFSNDCSIDKMLNRRSRLSSWRFTLNLIKSELDSPIFTCHHNVLVAVQNIGRYKSNFNKTFYKLDKVHFKLALVS